MSILFIYLFIYFHYEHFNGVVRESTYNSQFPLENATCNNPKMWTSVSCYSGKKTTILLASTCTRLKDVSSLLTNRLIQLSSNKIVKTTFCGT